MHGASRIGREQGLEGFQRAGVGFKCVQAGKLVARMRKVRRDDADIGANIPKNVAWLERLLEAPDQVRIMGLAQRDIHHAKGFYLAKIKQRHPHFRHGPWVRLKTWEESSELSEQPPGARKMQTSVDHAIKADEQVRNHDQRMLAKGRKKGKWFLSSSLSERSFS